jgi:hypothetical protein
MAQFGVVTAGGLTKAYNALRDSLDLVVVAQPKQPTSEELAQQEILKQHRDYMESIKPQPSFEDRVKTEQAKRLAEQATKAQADAKNQLEVTIANYQAYGLGRVDFLATEMVQKELSRLFITVAGKRDYVRSLEFVRRVITELPDHPRQGDVQKVVDSLRVQLA